MTYKRGATYWYKFRWTIKLQDGTRENYLIRKSAKTGSVKKAREVEEEHRRALRLGQIHPADPWPKQEPKAPEIPSLREFSKQFLAFVEVQKKPGTARFYQTGVKGMRPNSEIFPLEWVNVHLEGSQDAPQGFVHVTAGKTDSVVRNIPLTPRTREMLLARKQSGEKSRFVFPGPGTSGHLTTIQHAHERTIRDAGIKPFEFYCWRHTFGTRCAESGMDKFTLARLMGHSSPRVAERYYIHVTESHVMTGFERFLNYHSTKLADAVPKQTGRVQ